MRSITLTTNFGTHDRFVGTMKGVIVGIAPKAPVIDLTHEVPAGDIRAGAFALAASYRYFPKKTVHIAVVDPGVGSARKPIAVQTAHYFLLDRIMAFCHSRCEARSSKQFERSRIKITFYNPSVRHFMAVTSLPR